jgi:Uma2 family endonuclease
MTKAFECEPVWHVPARLRLELLALLSTDPMHTATMTYEEFLQWADEDTLAEWVDGKVIMTTPASARHQYLATFLHHILTAYASVHDLGTVLIAPFQMKLPHSAREPDVLFLAKDHLGRLQESRIEGPADLVVEIVSQESRGRDRGEKFYEYHEGGVPEYWLLDPQLEQAEFYQLDAQGRYQVAAPDANGIYHARVVPGFWLRVAWLWRQPLPDPVQVLLEIDRDAYTRYLHNRMHQAGS